MTRTNNRKNRLKNTTFLSGTILAGVLMFGMSSAQATPGLPVDLLQHEGTSRGHTLARHVWGWGDQVHQCRIRNKLGQQLDMTTFGTVGKANEMVNEALKYWKPVFANFARSGVTRQEHNVPDIEWGYWWSNTGWGVTCKDTNSWYYTTGVQIVINPKKSMPGGWYVLTAFPTR